MTTPNNPYNDNYDNLTSITQRTSYKNNEARWDDMFNRLELYKEKYGNCLVPKNYKDNDDKQLGFWVHNQRRNYKTKILSNNRVDKLKSIDFVFCRQQERDDIWNDMFERLISYKEKYGNCLVPFPYEEDKKLGNWVKNQRQRYNDSILSNERIIKLKSIGFLFNVRLQQVYDRWDTMYNRLLSYKQKYGDFSVPRNCEENKQLANWIMTQKGFYKNNKLPYDRIDKLKSIGFVFCQVTGNGRSIKLRKNNHNDIATDNTVPASVSSSSSCSETVTEIPSVRPISSRKNNCNECVHNDQEFDSLIEPVKIKQQKEALMDEVMMDENNYLRNEVDEAKPNKNNTVVTDRVAVLPATPIRIETTTTLVIRNPNTLKHEKKEKEEEKMKLANKYLYGESKRAAAISSIITDNSTLAISNDSNNSSLFDDAEEDDSFTAIWCLSSRASNTKNVTCDDNDSIFADAEEDIDSSWGCS